MVERASGLSYPEFVRTRIFTPLGLRSARFKSPREVVPNRADGYLFKDGDYQHGETLRPQIIAANGGILMNVQDFATWDLAITEGRLLRADSVTTMTTPVRLTNGRTVAHGLGWFLDTFNGHRFGAHWGTTVTGHSTVIRRYTDNRLTVIMLANLDDGGFGIDAMSKRIAGMSRARPRRSQPDAGIRHRRCRDGAGEGSLDLDWRRRGTQRRARPCQATAAAGPRARRGGVAIDCRL